jgi:hypothetical protein
MDVGNRDPYKDLKGFPPPGPPVFPPGDLSWEDTGRPCAPPSPEVQR